MNEENPHDQNPETPDRFISKSVGVEQNLASLIAYLWFGLAGLIIFFIERENKSVRFAAMQSVLFNLASLFVGVTVYLIGNYFTVIGTYLLFVLIIGYGLITITLMYKAYKNVEISLPLIGRVARNLAKR